MAKGNAWFVVLQKKNVYWIEPIPKGNQECKNFEYQFGMQINIFKDVRAHCYCASLLRTQIHIPRHPLSARTKQ